MSKPDAKRRYRRRRAIRDRPPAPDVLALLAAKLGGIEIAIAPFGVLPYRGADGRMVEAIHDTRRAGKVYVSKQVFAALLARFRASPGHVVRGQT